MILRHPRVTVGLVIICCSVALATPSYAGDWIRLRLDPATGETRAVFQATHAELVLPSVSVDGRVQSGFADSNSSGVYANSTLRVEIDRETSASAAIVWSALDGAVHDFVISIADNSHYYGCGERFTSLNHQGLILPMVSIDRPESKGSTTYKPVPFYMSTRGYAAWLDASEPGTFDLNATDRRHVLLTYSAKRLRLVLIAGPEMADMLAEFTRLTGRPRVPPLWSFAPWKSRDVHKNRDELLADAELTRKHDLPGSVIVIDSPWETSYNDFTLNEQQFSEPQQVFERFRQLGFYPCFWLTPFINIENSTDMAGIDPGPAKNFAEAKARGFLVKQSDGEPMIADWWKGRGALVDFTNPDAVRWWHDQLDRTKPWGLRAMKCDDGEGNFVEKAVFFDGSSAAAMKNRYAALYLQAAQGYIDSRLDGDGVLLARCGFTGTQQQPFCWAGDNHASFSYENGLPTVILAGQNAGLSGIPFWGSDIAGYMGTPDKETFIRWTQFGALSPLMMVHMTCNKGPWDYDEETLSIYRKFAKLHTSLAPYLLDAAEKAARTGMPIMRAMVLAFPNDPTAHAHRYQYMLGPDLLVAPMYQRGTHRSVYFPRTNGGAKWIDYWTGEEHECGENIEVEAPLDRIPLFVRAGAIIPRLPEDVDTLIARHPDLAENVVAIDDRRVIQIWPGSRISAPGKNGLMPDLRTSERISVTRIGREDMSERTKLMSAIPRRIYVQFMLQVDGRMAAIPRFDDAEPIQVGPEAVECATRILIP